MISTPPGMVIQQNMARNFFFYHASASTPPANHSDFFNTHACSRQPCGIGHTVFRVTRSIKNIAILLGVVVLLFAVLVLVTANFYIMPFARITEDGKPVGGYVHRNSYRRPLTRLVVTRSETGRRRSYLVGIDDAHGGPFVGYCDDWTPPQWPAILLPHVNPPCVHWYAADGSPTPYAPSRNIRTEKSAVEFTANDGKRIRVSW